MSIAVACACGKGMGVADAHAGMHGKCPECGRLFVVEGSPVPGRGAGVTAVEGQAEGDALVIDPPSGQENSPELVLIEDPPHQGQVKNAVFICAACGESLSADQGVSCRQCRGVAHLTCWQQRGGCSVPTCPAGPASRRKVIHVQGAEQHLRPCPVCAEPIPERAHRCRYCGEFTDKALRRVNKRRSAPYPIKTSNLAGLSTIMGLISMFLIVWARSDEVLRILSILPPMAAVGLGIWALADIRKEMGRKSGLWTAGFGIGFGGLGVLSWLVSFL